MLNYEELLKLNGNWIEYTVPFRFSVSNNKTIQPSIVIKNGFINMVCFQFLSFFFFKKKKILLFFFFKKINYFLFKKKKKKKNFYFFNIGKFILFFKIILKFL